ncbi:MAG: ATP-binding protein [Betaproteobacteria bacterium]|nr:ATP-binding protein [Betaproteobacteria bacterium]
MTTQALPAEQLYHPCELAELPFRTTDDLPPVDEAIGQERALSALRFAFGVHRDGYNLFVLGPTGLGKHTLVKRYLDGLASQEPTPPDCCYVNNFDEPHKPRCLTLPPGVGVRLREAMRHLVEELRAVIPAAFESEEYRAKAEEIDEELSERQDHAFKALGDEAAGAGIALLHTPSGFALAPTREGEVITPEAYDQLPDEEKARIEGVIADFQAKLQKIIRQVPQWRRERREKLRRLNEDITLAAVGHLIDELKEAFGAYPSVLEYLAEVRKDVLENEERFRKGDASQGGFLGMPLAEEPAFNRYRVNVLVDHSDAKGAPVVFQDNPQYPNLVGRVEHIAQMGALLTDFTLIKPGALHLANGGYLLLDAHKVLAQPFAWEGLKRALHAREVRIESLGQMLSLVSTVSLEPAPMALEVKVVLFGEPLLYYLLQAYDPEFGKLFKIAADFDEEIPRSPDHSLLYARLIATLVREASLMPFDQAAVARIIEHGARLTGDAERLSTHVESILDLVREADYWARQSGRALATQADVQQAIDSATHRIDRLRERLHEEILRGTVLIDTGGSRCGQINALSVIMLSNFAFAQPTRITATTRLGEGELIDVEREAALGGAIHSKGVLILSAFLAARYAKNRPIALSATLAFEQSYGMIDGDSASMAELCALLSSLADLPIAQSLAITGSVNQFGQAQAIGAVNEKIEGFFDICRARGLDGRHGVIIPRSNAKHLMLHQDVVEASRAGRFHVFAVDDVDQAMELLTGTPAGTADEAGHFPPNTVNYRVSARLHHLFALRQSFMESKKIGKPRRKPE